MRTFSCYYKVAEAPNLICVSINITRKSGIDQSGLNGQSINSDNICNVTP